MSNSKFEESLIDLLGDLVKIESVNPVFGGSGENNVSKFVQDWLSHRGIPYQLQSVAPGRDNVIARIGDSDVPGVLIEAHMDTVGTGGWTEGNAYEILQKDGRIYGRGTCDTKASLACFMSTIAYFHENMGELRCPIIFAASVDEESEQIGAYRLAELKNELGISYAITGEPTLNRVVSKHKGVCRYEIETRGTAVHGSTPELGENAIYQAAKICAALEIHGSELDAIPRKSEIERGTLNVGIIRGGIGFNVVPDRCLIELDRRLGVGETTESAEATLKSLVENFPGASVRSFLSRPPLTGVGSEVLVGDLLAAAKRSGTSSQEIEVSYMTNAVAYEEVGVASVVFGPGDIAQAHKADEYIEVGEMEKCFSILKRFFRA